MFKHLARISASSFLFALLATPAWPQAEVNPDHFPDQAFSGTLASSTLQARIQDQQALLTVYETQLRVKAKMVEEVRQETISAGIQGDGAGSYLDAYRDQQEQLQSLQQSLAVQIAQARNTIASLQAQNTLITSRNVPGKARVMAINASAPVLLSSQRSLRRASTHR
jgi:hypothetical protein